MAPQFKPSRFKPEPNKVVRFLRHWDLNLWVMEVSRSKEWDYLRFHKSGKSVQVVLQGFDIALISHLFYKNFQQIVFVAR